MAALSLEKKIVKALLAGDTELAQKLTEELKAAPKTKTVAKKKTVKKTGAAATKVKRQPKSPKTPSLTPPDSEFEISTESFNKKNPKIVFFDDGSFADDVKLDRKLLKGKQRVPRRDPVQMVSVECYLCSRKFEEFAHKVYQVEGEICPMLCKKCGSNGAPR